MKKVMSISAFCCLLCCLSAFSSLSVASFQTTSNLLLPPGGQYADSAGWYYSLGSGVFITNFTLSGFVAAEAVIPPAPGITITSSCNVQASGMKSVDGGQTYSPFTAATQLSFSITGGVAAINTQTFTAEMLSMNISINNSSPPWFLMIRESPTRASLGQTSITNLNNGFYAINSFFDVFTELSDNGGQFWYPSTDSSRLTLTPEPATLLLLGLGGMAVRSKKAKSKSFD